MEIKWSVKVIPNAKRSEVIEINENEKTMKVKLAAPPVDGKANEVLIKFLAEHFTVAKSKVRLLHGEKSRTKMVVIHS